MNRAIWDNYVFDPTFDEAYVDDMARTADFLDRRGASAATSIHVLDYTLHRAAQARSTRRWSKVDGRWKA